MPRPITRLPTIEWVRMKPGPEPGWRDDPHGRRRPRCHHRGIRHWASGTQRADDWISPLDGDHVAAAMPRAPASFGTRMRKAKAGCTPYSWPATRDSPWPRPGAARRPRPPPPRPAADIVWPRSCPMVAAACKDRNSDGGGDNDHARRVPGDQRAEGNVARENETSRQNRGTNRIEQPVLSTFGELCRRILRGWVCVFQPTVSELPFRGSWIRKSPARTVP